MKKTILSLALLCMTAPISAIADTTYTYPKENPVLSIAVPEDWKVESDESDAKGLIITSPDDGIELDLWALNTHSDPKKLAEELEANGEEIDELINEQVTDFKVTENKKGNINGIDAVLVGGTGKSKDDGKDVSVELMFLIPNETQVFGLMYWGSEEAEKANQVALQNISKSLKKP